MGPISVRWKCTACGRLNMVSIPGGRAWEHEIACPTCHHVLRDATSLSHQIPIDLSKGTGDIAVFAAGTEGLSSSVARIDHPGKGVLDGETQIGGADVAEFISGSSSLNPGDVVEIDADHPGKFRLSSRPNSSAVAGVISTDPGVSMNAPGAESQTMTGPQLALVGRVPVKVTIEGGPISAGDLLVSASTPGHAMRAPDAPLPGTIIGKALDSLTASEGVIEMLVMLR